jgi:two-component system chemotaxis response regulator CheY
MPAIIVSTEAEADDQLQAYRSGATGYLVKPVSPSQLLTHVRLMLGEHSQ